VEPFELQLDLRAACVDNAAADDLWERIVASLPEGVILEGGGWSRMPREEVVPGSPLAVQLSDGVQAATM
jgi:hypothetical protein